MPRPKNTFERTNETYEVLRRHVKAVSARYPCHYSFIYAIKEGNANDPYAAFRYLFLAAVLAGAPVEAWLSDLHGIVENINKPKQLNGIGALTATLIEKIKGEGEENAEILAALQDGLTRDELYRIREARKALKLIEADLDNFLDSELARMNGERFKIVPKAASR